MSKKVHDLSAYALAADIVKNYPKIKKELDSAKKVLYPYKKYACVSNILDEVEKSLEHIREYLPFYKKILAEKGEV